MSSPADDNAAAAVSSSSSTDTSSPVDSSDNGETSVASASTPDSSSADGGADGGAASPASSSAADSAADDGGSDGGDIGGASTQSTDSSTADDGSDGGDSNVGSTSAAGDGAASASASAMSLADYLQSADVHVEAQSDGLHIGIAFLEALHTALDIAEVVTPPLVVEGATSGVAVTLATGAGLTFTVAGPVLGLVGVFAALGAGYDEARTIIKNEATASGFSQGFVCGILNMSGGTVSSIFGKHGVIPTNTFDQEADVIATNAYNKGLVAGYTFANLATADEKKSFVLEIRRFTGNVSADPWSDNNVKRDYVIEYAAKLRLNFLHL